MSFTLQNMIDRTRTILVDLKTRSDATVVTPFWSDTELISEINAALRARAGFVSKRDKNFYMSKKSYIGRTDATDADFEYYNLPAAAGLTMRLWHVLRRSDLAGKPAVSKVEPEMQDPVANQQNGLFDDLIADYPENGTPSGQTVSIVSSTQFRIKPAPTSTSFTYQLWYQRFPAELAGTQVLSVYTETVDAPESMRDLYCYDVAIKLLKHRNRMTKNLEEERASLFADVLEEDAGRDGGHASFGAVRWRRE